MRCYTWSSGELLEGFETVNDEHLGPVVFLGESGRRRRYEKIALDRKRPALVADGAILDAYPRKITLLPKNGNPGKTFYVLKKPHHNSRHVLVRVRTVVEYTQEACGGWHAESGAPDVFVWGYGAFGTDGRLGAWNDGICLLRPGDVLKIFSSDGEEHALWYQENGRLCTALWSHYERRMEAEEEESEEGYEDEYEEEDCYEEEDEDSCDCWCHECDCCEGYGGCDCTCHECDCCEAEEDEDDDWEESEESTEDRVERIRARLNARECVVAQDVNGDNHNAFAGEDGCIYLTRNLVESCDDDELAFVIAHEEAHFALGHRATMERVLKQEGDELRRKVQDIQSSGKGFIRRAGGIAKEFVSSYARVVSRKLDNEFEADAQSAARVRAHGYNPEGGVRFLQSIDRDSEVTIKQVLVPTHPSTRSRIWNIRSKRQ